MTTATRTWTRATLVEHCGLCGHEISSGEPVLLLKLPLLKRALKRCKGCVGPAPPDLPALIERRELPTFKPFVHITTRPDALPLDFKSAAAGEAWADSNRQEDERGEREPGEDG